jgi:RNA polymerase sigma-70 factor (ECF subfamily)
MIVCDCPPYDCAGQVRLYLAGDREAGNELARKFTSLVWSIVMRVLGPARREEWEDASQVIFLRVFANLEKWEKRCPFCKWLAIVAARRAIDCIGMHEPVVQLTIDPPDPSVLDPDTMDCIKTRVAGLSPELQQLFEMWKQGLSREEMARQLGKSLRTIHYWLADIREALQDCLPD